MKLLDSIDIGVLGKAVYSVSKYYFNEAIYRMGWVLLSYKSNYSATLSLDYSRG